MHYKHNQNKTYLSKTSLYALQLGTAAGGGGVIAISLLFFSFNLPNNTHKIIT